MGADVIVYDCDVLVIGSGFSGSWAALRAAQLGRKVLVVDKGPRDWGGLGMQSGGDMIVMQPEDNVHDLLDELVYYFDGLCDQEQVRAILEDSYRRFCDLENWGHKFTRDANGKLQSILQRGLSHMRYYRYEPYGQGGLHTTVTLQQKMREYGVRRFSNLEITDLIKEDGRVCGAVGFQTRSATPCLIRAKSVVMCTHTGGWKQSYLGNTCAGEGAALAFKAGGRLRNMEFLQVWNVPAMFAWEGQTGMLPYGARFLNSEGEDFMQRYSPKSGAKVDPHYNIRGMALEERAGRGPIWFDTSTMSEEGVRVMTPTFGWMLLNAQKLQRLGTDFFHMKTEWMPQAHLSYGGVDADLNGWTGVPGLYVAGRALAANVGVYMGGWDTCITSTTGYTAGESAARDAEGTEQRLRDEGGALERLGLTLEKLGRPGYAPKDIVRRNQEIIAPLDVCILKTGKGLTAALEKTAQLRDEVLPQMSAADPHYLLKLVEARSMTLLTEMYLKAALARQESRCGHYREDFPQRNDEISWMIVENADGEVQVRSRRLPVETYPVRPHRYHMDDFRFPDPAGCEAGA